MNKASGPLGEITWFTKKYAYSDINMTFNEKGHEVQQTKEMLDLVCS